MKELPSEEEEIPFRIKTYKKKELACMYNPNITPPVSYTHLKYIDFIFIPNKTWIIF